MLGEHFHHLAEKMKIRLETLLFYSWPIVVAFFWSNVKVVFVSWRQISGVVKAHLESLEIVDENVWQPEVVDELKADWKHVD